MKAIVAIAVAGLVVGIVGGLLGNNAWFYGGEAVAFVGFLTLWVYSIWKRPQSIVDLDGATLDYETPPVDPARAEQELQRKNRGYCPNSE